MESWIYTHNLDPVMFSIGPVNVAWYGFMYFLSYVLCYLIAHRKALRMEATNATGWLNTDQLATLAPWVFVGVVLGGRLGWFIFYGGPSYWAEPWRVIETWRGGMSYHGGLLGVIIALLFLDSKRGIPFCDSVRVCTTLFPIALGLGRIGNFINAELYGMATDGTWGVIFEQNGLPRHPTQLYEAFLEGLVMAIIMQIMLTRAKYASTMFGAYLFLYGLFRWIVEYVRLPDAHIGYILNYFTMGQLLSLPMMLIGVYLIIKHPSFNQPGTLFVNKNSNKRQKVGKKAGRRS